MVQKNLYQFIPAYRDSPGLNLTILQCPDFLASTSHARARRHFKAAWPPKPNIWQPITSAAPAQSRLSQPVCTPVIPHHPVVQIGAASGNCRSGAVPLFVDRFEQVFYRNTIFERSRFNMLNGWQRLHRQGAAVTPARSPVRQRAS